MRSVGRWGREMEIHQKTQDLRFTDCQFWWICDSALNVVSVHLGRRVRYQQFVTCDSTECVYANMRDRLSGTEYAKKYNGCLYLRQNPVQWTDPHEPVEKNVKIIKLCFWKMRSSGNRSHMFPESRSKRCSLYTTPFNIGFPSISFLSERCGPCERALLLRIHLDIGLTIDIGSSIWIWLPDRIVCYQSCVSVLSMYFHHWCSL